MLSKILPALALVGVLVGLFHHHSSQHQHHASDFEEWKKVHGIHYCTAENFFREAVFYSNVQKVQEHNANPSRTYDMGINHLSALTQEEFVRTYLTLNTNAKPLTVEQEEDSLLGDIDWTTVGAVTPVKDQGQCSSGWAFSATGALEALCKVNNGTLLSFSEQQLIDCSTSYGNNGCNGGTMDFAFKYAHERGNIKFNYRHCH